MVCRGDDGMSGDIFAVLPVRLGHRLKRGRSGYECDTTHHQGCINQNNGYASNIRPHPLRFSRSV
jgi:hypothetical protein